MSLTFPNYYEATTPRHEPARVLQGPHDAGVCVVGGGFAGLGTALSLVERGRRDVTLIESRRVGFGASGRNGGFVFAGYSRGEEALFRELGPQRARRLYQGSRDAVELIRQRTDRYGAYSNELDRQYRSELITVPAVIHGVLPLVPLRI